MGTPITTALIVSSDPEVTGLLNGLLSCQSVVSEYRQKLDDSLTRGKISRADLLLIDFCNVKKDLPNLLGLFENLQAQQEAILVTSIQAFNTIWKFLEKYSYSLILKPCKVDKIDALVGSAIARIRQKQTLRQRSGKPYVRGFAAKFPHAFSVAPKDLLDVSAAVMGEALTGTDGLPAKESGIGRCFSKEEMEQSSALTPSLQPGGKPFARQVAVNDYAPEDTKQKENDALLPLFCDNLPIGVLELSSGGVIVSANAAVEKCLGSDIGKLAGRDVREVVHAKDRDAMERLLEVKATGQKHNDVSEIRFLDKANNAIPLIATSFLLPQGNGKDRLFITLRGVEERRQLAELQSSHQDLQNYIHSIADRHELTTGRGIDLVAKARLASLAYLNGRVGREIRAAVGAILTTTELAGRKMGSVQGMLALETIYHNARKIRDLVQTYSHASMQQEVDLKPHGLRFLLEEAIAELERSRILKDIRVEILCTDTLPKVHVDRGLFHHVIRQLTLNALASMQDCDRRILTFTGEFDQSEQMVKLSIQDTGQGIAPEHLQNMFKPSYSPGQNDASELGLAMVKEIIENDFDGRISVRSELGRGSKFSLWLCPEAAPAVQEIEDEFFHRDVGLNEAQDVNAHVLSVEKV